MELNKVYNMNCLDGMKLMNENSVDLTVTSPPYDDLRKYKGYSFDFEPIARELYRVTKEGGIVVWVVGDGHDKNGSETLTSFKQGLYFKDIGFNMHDTMIYQKNSYPFPPSYRYCQQFEYMFVLSKGKPMTHNLQMVKTKWQKKTSEISTTRMPNGETKEMKYEKGKDTRIMDNVWLIDTGYMRTTKDKFAYKHPAMFPEEMCQRHILAWSNENDIIFDPFMGSGTTAKMASLNNRKWIGFEMSEEYCNITKNRIESIII